MQRGNIAQAELLARDAVAEARLTFGNSHRAIDQSLATLGLLLRFASRYPEAEQALRKVLTLREQALGPAEPAVAVLLNNLALAVEALGRKDEADLLIVRATAIHAGAAATPH